MAQGHRLKEESRPEITLDPCLACFFPTTSIAPHGSLHGDTEGIQKDSSSRPGGRREGSRSQGLGGSAVKSGRRWQEGGAKSRGSQDI